MSDFKLSAAVLSFEVLGVVEGCVKPTTTTSTTTTTATATSAGRR